VSALASALLFVFLKVGPNQFLVYDQLARRDAVDRHFLPIEGIYEVGKEPLWLVFHQQKDWNKAFYLPKGSAALAGERSLPGLDLPRLYLYRPYYLKQGRLPDFKDLAVDTGSAYFTATMEKRAEKKMVDAKVRAQAEKRADLVFPEVPVGQRVEVYGASLAEFAGHLMSIANEISRAKRRGIDLCPKAKEAPLLRHWRNAFGPSQFFGLYTPEGSFETVATERSLELEDKLLAAKVLLGRSRWKGDPVADLQVCL
jgi:hypothetical protein